MVTNKTQRLTSLVLQDRVNQNLQQFITEQLELGNDTTGIQAALFIATGEMYDRRTVDKWVKECS